MGGDIWDLPERAGYELGRGEGTDTEPVLPVRGAELRNIKGFERPLVADVDVV